MSTVPGLIAAAVGLLLAGVGIGYWVANIRTGKATAKAEDVQHEYDDYRRDVTEHFGRTAAHFQSIGEQYRELYEHMASGAEALCDRRQMDEQLSFAPLALSRAAAAEPADGAAKDYPDAADPVPGHDAVVAEVDEAVAAEVASGASPDREQQEDGPTSTADEAGSEAVDSAGEAASAAPRDYADEFGSVVEPDTAAAGADRADETPSDETEQSAESAKGEKTEDAPHTYH